MAATRMSLSGMRQGGKTNVFAADDSGDREVGLSEQGRTSSAGS
jgi:hypothetical protein